MATLHDRSSGEYFEKDEIETHRRSSSKSETDFFAMFWNHIKNFTISSQQCPYGFVNTHHSQSVKRSHDDSLHTPDGDFKRQKKNLAMTKTRKHVSNEDSLSVKISSLNPEQHQRKAVSIEPCSFSTYLEFIDILCRYSGCPACQYTANVNEPMESVAQMNEPMKSAAQMSDVTCTDDTSLKDTCFSVDNKNIEDNFQGTYESNQLLKVEDKDGMHEMYANQLSTDVSTASKPQSLEQSGTSLTVSSSTKDCPLDVSNLSDKEITECFLTSVLHPDIISQVAVHFKKQCELYKQSKK